MSATKYFRGSPDTATFKYVRGYSDGAVCLFDWRKATVSSQCGPDFRFECMLICQSLGASQENIRASLFRQRSFSFNICNLLHTRVESSGKGNRYFWGWRIGFLGFVADCILLAGFKRGYFLVVKYIRTAMLILKNAVLHIRVSSTYRKGERRIKEIAQLRRLIMVLLNQIGISISSSTALGK